MKTFNSGTIVFARLIRKLFQKTFRGSMAPNSLSTHPVCQGKSFDITTVVWCVGERIS